MRLLQRLGIAVDRGKVIVMAVVFGLVFGPKLLQRLHCLPRLGPPVVEVPAHHRRLFPVPARPDPEDEPAAAVKVEHRDLFGEYQGIAFWH